MRTADQADGMTVLPPLTRNGAEEWQACRDAGIRAVLARRVPVAALAAGLGLADPIGAAEAVPAVAAAYFPGAGAEAERRADAATAWLAGALREVPGPPAGPELIAARIALMVQACEATAGLTSRVPQRLEVTLA
jgi:hypothetical protein